MINLNKTIISIVFIAFAFFAILSISTLSISQNSPFCETKLFKPLIPWSSGCFYGVLFKEKSNINPGEIEAEKLALDTFSANSGIDENILLYRLKFHQTYRLKFKTSYQDIHSMYLEYRESEHFFLNHHTDYITYLASNNLLPLAQGTLNDFCDTYIQDVRKFEHLVSTMQRLLENNNVTLNFDHCYAPFSTQLSQN